MQLFFMISQAIIAEVTGVLFPVIAAQNGGADSNFDIDLMIHIGYVFCLHMYGEGNVASEY